MVYKSSAKRLKGVILTLTVFVALPFVVRAWTEPSTSAPFYSAVTPTGGEIAEIINNSSATQTKFGSLLIGSNTATSWLCLNPDTGVSLSDAANSQNCIKSWSEISNLIAGGQSYVHAKSAAVTDTGSTSYLGTPDYGYFKIQSMYGYGLKLQQYTLLATAPDGVNTSAIRADALSDSNYAARFLGTVYVAGNESDVYGRPTNLGQICLNDKKTDGTAGTGRCISNWSDVIQATYPTIVRLQQTRAFALRIPDSGDVAAQGVLQAGSIVLGQYGYTAPISDTCGDNFCSIINGETFSNCAIDCL